MNLILTTPEDMVSPTRARLTGRRFQHVSQVHRAKLGDELKVGEVNGLMGTGQIVLMEDGMLELELALQSEPPEPLALTLFLALPRPKFLAKTLQTATSLGVKEIYLFNSYRVDKVYWSCKQIETQEMREARLLGLEQARDTRLPQIHLRQLFKPFVEDELPSLIRGSEALLAHPIAQSECPRGLTHQVSLAIGPEGGFIDYEVAKLEEAGFETVKLTPRILKVETAVATLIGRLT